MYFQPYSPAFEDEWTEGWKQKVWYVLCPGAWRLSASLVLRFALPRMLYIEHWLLCGMSSFAWELQWEQVHFPALPGVLKHSPRHHCGEFLASEAGEAIKPEMWCNIVTTYLGR